jgi:hypothetical protein
MQKFMALIGIQGGRPSPPEDQHSHDQVEAMAIMQRNFEFFFSRYIRNLSRYRIDAAALKSCSCRIVAAVGSESSGQLAHNGGLGLAQLLGVPATVFPGDHGGFQGRPEEFATKLREVPGSCAPSGTACHDTPGVLWTRPRRKR